MASYSQVPSMAHLGTDGVSAVLFRSTFFWEFNMTQQTYSSFKPAYNYAYDRDPKQPKYIDRNAVILDGAAPVAFEIAVFANKAEPGADPNRPTYRLVATPKSGTLRAAQADFMNGSKPTPRPDNAPANYDDAKARAGYGGLWKVARADVDAARRRGDEHVRTHYGQLVVLLPNGKTSAIDPVLFGRHNKGSDKSSEFDFHSGSLNPHDPDDAARARAANASRPGAGPSHTPKPASAPSVI